MKARKKGEQEWKEYKEVFGPDGEFVGLETAGYTKSVEQIMQELNIDPEIDPFAKSRIQPKYVSRVLPLECFDLWSRDDEAAERLAEEFANRNEGQLLYVNPWEDFRKEAAKDILCSILANPKRIKSLESGRTDYRQHDYVDEAIKQTDILIDRLKEVRK